MVLLYYLGGQMNDTLNEALNKLDELLKARSLKIEIVICGAYSIQLHGFLRSLHTQDVDSLKPINSANVLKAIEEVGLSLGLGPRWLNDQASTVSIPMGAVARAKEMNKWTAIKASLIDRVDLIKMKVSAFSIRRGETNKDWEDLILLAPTSAEIDAAIEFIKEKNAPPVRSAKKFKDEFEETINDLKKLVK
jgi:hypothetical protein